MGEALYANGTPKIVRTYKGWLVAVVRGTANSVTRTVMVRYFGDPEAFRVSIRDLL